MKTGKFIGIGLALYLAGILGLIAQTADSTSQILHLRTFREGLVCLGGQSTNEAENQALLLVLNHLDEPSWTARLEQFLKDHPQSPWAASLHYDYASFCRRTGRTTKALEHFEAAWKLTQNDTSPQGQRLGGAVLANWTDLLASLGRGEKLKELIAAGDQCHFLNSQDRNKFEGAKNSYFLMQAHPEIAYRCGTFALKAVAEKLQSTNTALETLVELPSPTNGFSMSQLVNLAKQYGLDLMAVRRSLQMATGGQDLIVPSVVHWRENHYAAILDQRDDLYLVGDPTFGSQKWIPGKVINEEASGEFLIPASSNSPAWTQLARAEQEHIHGMGVKFNINDAKDKGCPKKCSSCHGMPNWWVTEPYINLWIADEPISYLTSRGESFALQISFKQRDTVSPPGWENSWASAAEMDGKVPCGGQACTTFFGNSDIGIDLPGGGEVFFPAASSLNVNDRTPRYDTETRMFVQPEQTNFVSESGIDDGSFGLRLVHADGAQDIYLVDYAGGLAGDYPHGSGILVRHIEPNGDTTFYHYGAAGNLASLTGVVDPDGRTNSLTYTASGLLSAVTNAYGQSAHFKYDSLGNLTNIVDAQGLPSSITYDTNGVPASLKTPYGTTTFSVYENSLVASTNGSDGNFGAYKIVDRAVQVTDPVGANYLYLYRNDCSSDTPVNLPTAFASGVVPAGTPLGTLDDGTTGTNNLAPVCYRNSFYWGPRQYASLSTSVFTNFTANDYLRGRMQHWLEDTNQQDLTGYLSVQQDPSPDGSTAGLLTFYDYQGKLSGYNFCAGTSALPAVTAWRLPNGETHYEFLQYDYLGNLTNDVTSYTKADGSLGTRTNQFVYANNTYTYKIGGWTGTTFNGSVTTTYIVPNLLTQVIGPDGNPIWSYGGFDTVSWTNFYGFSGQSNASITTCSRVLPDYATNGLGQVTSNTYSSSGNSAMVSTYGAGVTAYTGRDKILSATTAAGLTTTNIYDANGFLTRTIDLQIGRTNSFSYTTDGLIGTLTNALGLNVSATWDNLLRLTSVQFPDGSYVSNTFNKLDLSGTRDRLGNWTQYVYDGARHLINVTNANNAGTTLQWCGCGALTAIIDPLTNTTSFNYDLQGNLTNIAYPDGSALHCQYNLAAWPTNISDGAGRALRLVYNNQGLVTNITSAIGTLESTVYDVRDRPINVTDANSITVTNSYDVMGELLSRTWPDGIGEAFGYNAAGLIAYTNRDSQRTLFGRNPAGWPMATTNANNETVQVGRNPLGRITTLTNELRQVTQFQYNQFDWLTNKIDALGRVVFRLTYNPNGWLTNRWTPEKGNIVYLRNNLGRATNVVYPQFTNSYAYNADNELTNMLDLAGQTAFGWSPAGQLTNEVGPWPNDSVGSVYSQGLRALLTIGSTWSQTYNYDAVWRMTNTVSPAGAFNYSFQSTNFNLPSVISLPNGASIVNSFDSLARFKETDLKNYWSHTLDGYAYTLDPLGLRTNIIRNLGLTSNTVTVAYDHIAQITSWQAKESSGTPRQNEQHAFNYDAAHNLHYRTNNALAQTFITDGANELTNVSRTGTFALTGALPAPSTNVTVNGQAAQVYGDFTFAATNLSLVNGANAFTNVAVNLYGVRITNIVTVNLPQSVNLGFDNNGSLTNDGIRTFAFDSDNQLTNATILNKIRKDFVFDGLHRLRIKREYGWIGSTWVKTNEVRYVWDGASIVQLRDSNNVPTLTLTRGLDLSGSIQGAGGIGGLLAMTDGSGASAFYHQDALGNVTALIDFSENIVGRREYDAFGRTISQTGKSAGTNPFWQNGQLRDEDLDINSHLYRSYTPSLQRWLNQDPIQEQGGINLYHFVGNSPINRVDPLGLLDLLSAPPASSPVLDAPSVPGVPGLTTPAEVAAANANTAAELGEGEVSGGPLTAMLTAMSAGTLLLGDALGVQRDAELYPSGVNGPANKPFPDPGPQLLPSAPPPRKPPCNTKTTTGFPGDQNENHHRLPQQFKKWFESPPRNLNIEDYTQDMPMQWHRGEDIGLHPDYNAAWADFIEEFPNASAVQTIQFMNQLENAMGFGVLPP